MKPDNDLAIFTDAVLATAGAEAGEIMDAVNERRAKAIAAAENAILNDSYRHIQTEVAAIRARTGERISRKDLECKQAFFTRREEIIREVMSEVKKRIGDFINSDGYNERLADMARGLAKSVGPGAVTVFLRKEDEAQKDRIAACFDGNVTFEISGVKLGGMMVIPAGSGKCYDQTFDSTLEDVESRFLEIVGLGL